MGLANFLSPAGTVAVLVRATVMGKRIAYHHASFSTLDKLKKKCCTRQRRRCGEECLSFAGKHSRGSSLKFSRICSSSVIVSSSRTTVQGRTSRDSAPVIILYRGLKFDFEFRFEDETYVNFKQGTRAKRTLFLLHWHSYIPDRTAE